MGKPVIHIEKVTKKYKDTEFFAVQTTDLLIEKEEFFGLLGPNGAGKTTLISMLCGLLKPTEGKLSVNQMTYQKNKRKIQQIIGVVPQEYALYPTLSAYENLHYFGSMYGLKGKDLKSKIDIYLSNLGLKQFANKKIKTFSGGMKRRVNLIAGVMHNPEILFLDEPTVGVDVQSKRVIIDFLKELNQKGTTIIYTSHHMLEAQELCTRVAIIDSGRIISKGTPDDLIASVDNAKSLEDVYLHITGTKLRDHV